MPAWCADRYLKVVHAYSGLQDELADRAQLASIRIRQVATATAAMTAAQRSADRANARLDEVLEQLNEPLPIYKEPVVAYLGGVGTTLIVVGAVVAIVVAGGPP